MGPVPECQPMYIPVASAYLLYCYTVSAGASHCIPQAKENIRTLSALPTPSQGAHPVDGIN